MATVSTPPKQTAPAPPPEQALPPRDGPPPPPVLKVTPYEKVSSFLVALVLGLIIVVFVLSVVYLANRLPRSSAAVPLEIIDLPGGAEDGAVDETLRVDSPEELSQDASLAEVLEDVTEIEEVLENVIELADQASNQAQQQFDFALESSGTPGSATGTGRRALGMGPGESGLPREQRWYISFDERGTLQEYARQLDHFGIELGALLPEGRLVILSNLTADRPAVTTKSTGKDENRLYMNWQGGNRRQADVELFKKAGIDVGRQGVVLHFYPQRTESMLARLERDYANRSTDHIRRTYFVVRSTRGGYEFVVTRQTYFD
jgi:hypothetical protein